MTAPEAGWYPDESDPGLARYWDGSAWTDQTRPRGEVGGPGGDDAVEVTLGEAHEVGDTPDPPPPPPAAAPPPPAAPAPAPAPAERPAKRRSLPAWSGHPITLISAFFVLAALIAGLVVVLTGDEAAATEVALESVSAEGTDPFMDSIATDAVNPDGIEAGGVQEISTDTDTPVAQISGETPGLYGGTGQAAVCDPAALVAFLDDNPDKAAAFASVEGISPGGIGDFVASLTPVLLREDTRVTNHGFSDGTATPFQSVLQAGTAVMVDQRGVPRVRCECGNPLVEPEGSTTDLDFTGDAWAGFDDTRLVAVEPAPQELETLTITDVDTGDTEQIDTGSASTDTGGVVLLPDGLGVVDFGASADDTFAALTEALGEPDNGIQVTPGSDTPVPSGNACLAGIESNGAVRSANWGRLRVAAGDTVGFFVWRLDTFPSDPQFPIEDSPLTTPEGLGQDTTREQFEEAYGPVTVDRQEGIEGDLDAIIETLTGSGYEAVVTDGEFIQLGAEGQPSEQVCVGVDGFGF